jgi:hypothetical protein
MRLESFDHILGRIRDNVLTLFTQECEAKENDSVPRTPVTQPAPTPDQRPMSGTVRALMERFDQLRNQVHSNSFPFASGISQQNFVKATHVLRADFAAVRCPKPAQHSRAFRTFPAPPRRLPSRCRPARRQREAYARSTSAGAAHSGSPAETRFRSPRRRPLRRMQGGRTSWFLRPYPLQPRSNLAL